MSKKTKTVWHYANPVTRIRACDSNFGMATDNEKKVNCKECKLIIFEEKCDAEKEDLRGDSPNSYH